MVSDMVYLSFLQQYCSVSVNGEDENMSLILVIVNYYLNFLVAIVHAHS